MYEPHSRLYVESERERSQLAAERYAQLEAAAARRAERRSSGRAPWLSRLGLPRTADAKRAV